MSSRDYRYPPDEFDRIDDGPVGVHRAPRSAWSRIVPYLVVALVALAAALILYLQVSSQRIGDSAPTPTATDTALQEASPTTGSAPASESPATSGPASPSPTPSPSPSPAGDVAFDAPVQVLNGSGIAGLAARSAATLEQAGFSAVSTGNYAGTPLTASVVYYRVAADEDTARAVADSLGISEVQVAPALSGRIAAVLVTG